MQRSISESEKKVVAARQGWKCSVCLSLLPAAYQIDHSVPLCDGGADTIANCTAMCPNCHAEKTQLETIARNKSAARRVPAYSDREDVFVSPTTVRCSLCLRTRSVLLEHNICLAIEAPYVLTQAVQNRLAEFAFIPRHNRASSAPTMAMQCSSSIN